MNGSWESSGDNSAAKRMESFLHGYNVALFIPISVIVGAFFAVFIVAAIVYFYVLFCDKSELEK